MLSLHGSTWEEEGEEGQGSIGGRVMEDSSFSSFKSMLEVEDEFLTTNNSCTNSNIIIQDGLALPPPHHHHSNSSVGDHFLHNQHQVDNSSSSCSPSSSVFHNLGGDPSPHHYFMQPSSSSHKATTLSSLLNVVPTNPLEQGFGLGEFGFVDNQVGVGLGGSSLLGNFNDLSSTPGLCAPPPDMQFSSARMFHLPENGHGFGGFRGLDENSGGGIPLLNRSKLLRPLESFPPMGAQPTLFQKRAALRKNLAGNSGTTNGDVGKREMVMHLSEDNGRKRRWGGSQDDFLDDVSLDGSALNYDSDDFTESHKVDEIGKGGEKSSNANSTVTVGGGDQKGKKKGLPAKNLMAERRRRKKLNDRLYMLRSVVPKISKMDRASILGDAIEYLKELLQRINDLHNELESTPPGSSSTPTTSFNPLTPTPSALPSRIMDKLCPSSLPSPNGQGGPRVEVRAREGRAVNIHMFCGRKPGLLLSAMRALDNLGLDVQQAVISCFSGFAMDIFRAEQCQDSHDVLPEHIKAVLLDAAGFHGMM